MKNINWGFMVKRDKHTETMRPFLISTLARYVFFPDGKSLAEKWESNVNTSLQITHVDEQVNSNGLQFNWSCTIFGNERFMLNGHFKPTIDNDPLTIDNNGENSNSGSIVLTKIDDQTGETYEEIIPYGSNAVIDQYVFSIPLPSNFAGDKTMNFTSFVTNISEGSESDFLVNNTLHSIFTGYSNDSLKIYLNHHKGLDTINISSIPSITGDFNISINGSFI